MEARFTAPQLLVSRYKYSRAHRCNYYHCSLLSACVGCWCVAAGPVF